MEGSESKKRKATVNRLRNRVFNEVYGRPDFARLYTDAPAMERIGYGTFSLAHYEISAELYDTAESQLLAILAKAKQTRTDVRKA